MPSAQISLPKISLQEIAIESIDGVPEPPKDFSSTGFVITRELPEGLTEILFPDGGRERTVLIPCAECDERLPRRCFPVLKCQTEGIEREMPMFRVEELSLLPIRDEQVRICNFCLKGIIAIEKRLRRKRNAKDAAARRYAALMAATPDWVNRGAIKAIYATARRQSEKYGKPFHVDHIVPLQSDVVCGLHVPCNLQVLSATANCSKSNKFDSVEITQTR